MTTAQRIAFAASACGIAGMLLLGRADPIATGAFVFVVPGLLLAWASRRFPGHSAPARIGAWLLLFSALGYAMQGLFAFDAGDPEAFASRMRVLAWTLWWIAFVPGALLLALSRGAAFVVASVAAAMLVCVPALWPLPRAALPPAQIAATLAWLAWWVFAARRAALSRGAA